mgnify:CR=1 FL=1
MKRVYFCILLSCIYCSALIADNIDRDFLIIQFSSVFPNESKLIDIFGQHMECGYMMSYNDFTYKEIAIFASHPDTIYYIILNEFERKNDDVHLALKTRSKSFKTTHNQKLLYNISLAYDSLFINIFPKITLRKPQIFFPCREVKMPNRCVLADRNNNIIAETYEEYQLECPEWMSEAFFIGFLQRTSSLRVLAWQNALNENFGMEHQKKETIFWSSRFYKAIDYEGNLIVRAQGGMFVRTH